MKTGDYLRVYHSPRRFPMIQNYDWEASMETKLNMNKTTNKTSNSNCDERIYSFSTSKSFSSLPLKGAIVAEDIDLGYIVINKPSGVPVHPTVDNELENVFSEISRVLLKRAKTVVQSVDVVDPNITPNSSTSFPTKVEQKNRRRQKIKKEPLVYVTTQQRLDQNTSGLFVVSTKKSFASYFAKLLSQKTEIQLLQKKMSNENYKNNIANSGVHKKYKCLVCILSEDEKGEKCAL